MNVNCPHCGTVVGNAPHLANQVVSCPACVREFTMPPWQELTIPPPVPQIVQHRPAPVLIVNETPTVSVRIPQQKRLRSRDWFTNSLGVSAGFFLCAFMFLLLTCGGAWYWVRWNVVTTVGEIKQSINEKHAAGRKMALPLLKPFGIERISDSATVIDLGDQWTVTGVGQDKSGNTRSFTAVIEVASFSGKQTTKLLSLEMDGEEVRFKNRKK